MNKQERLDGFLHDLEEAEHLLQQLAQDFKFAGSWQARRNYAYVAMLMNLVSKLRDLFSGEKPGNILMTDEQITILVRAYTLVARATSYICREDLIPKEKYSRIAPFGKILNEFWELLPFAKMVQDRVPDIARRKS